MNLIFFLLVSLSTTPVETSIRVGVISDSHGDLVSVRKALQHFKDLNITHLIVTGDLVGFFDAKTAEVKQKVDEINKDPQRLDSETEKLTDLYRQLRKYAEEQFNEFWNLIYEFKFNPETTYFFPGNWDAAYIVHFHERRLGAKILSYDFRGWTELQLGTHRLIVSHMPVYELPRDLINSRMDPLTPLSMSLDAPIGHAGDIWIFGHTHKNLIYHDPKNSLWVFNPGALLSVKRGDSPTSYGFIDLNPENPKLQIFGIERNILEEKSMATCSTQLAKIGDPAVVTE